MPETDIINPTAGWDTALGDSMNPSYRFVLRRPSTLLMKKPTGGSPWTRDTQNTGHKFELGWSGRTLACARRIKQYYEQYEQGFFTFVDWDNGGRHYVGRFTSEPQLSEANNNKWNVQGAIFEEMPGAPMVNYPSDWDHDSILLRAFDDYGDQKVATSGSWSEGATLHEFSITLGGFARVHAAADATMYNPGNTAGDWATFAYRGYGFKLWMETGGAFGGCDVYLDGVKLATVDCYAPANTGPAVVLTKEDVPLDIHEVQVVVNATAHTSGGFAHISWYGLQVMR